MLFCQPPPFSKLLLTWIVCEEIDSALGIFIREIKICKSCKNKYLKTIKDPFYLLDVSLKWVDRSLALETVMDTPCISNETLVTQCFIIMYIFFVPHSRTYMRWQKHSQHHSLWDRFFSLCWKSLLRIYFCLWLS
jgi:hypothetical protein